MFMMLDVFIIMCVHMVCSCNVVCVCVCVCVCDSLASQTQPTPAQITFSVTHGAMIMKAICARVGWV